MYTKERRVLIVKTHYTFGESFAQRLFAKFKD